MTAHVEKTARLFVAAVVAAVVLSFSQAQAASGKPTIFLVHGAFADSSSWNGVVTRLLADGYPAVAAAVPLRSVKGDARALTSLLASIPGPVVLVGHSYGGEVISVAAEGRGNVKALVFVAGLAPDVGESAADLGNRFPTGTLGSALDAPVTQADAEKDLYIQQAKFWKQFAADVPEGEAKTMAVAQRPITEAALNERVAAAAWKTLPSYFIYGSLDRNIPAALHAFMAGRAHAKESVEIAGASHVVMISHAPEVAAMIELAASLP
ncbi:alpha/beta fold hydrolase [Lichenifustis flavocetrariae]|uniref:Alpha/beta hydrolase n=1 Tax=Lichenifustis flavocetrariae TaxID=2949735 RepID=A0AA42CLM1_9HYPH|nr:alpha/beta hydrolase [Lichenifustis flavocetrariae]MCW6511718.1 alpha/beta hydrolase [Lichenifustis flavocetrariae]